METAKDFLPLVNSLGIMALLGLAYGVIRRRSWNIHLRMSVLGALFGLGAVCNMLQPIPVMDGEVFVDTRTLYVGFAGAFLGPLGAAIAAAIAVTGRVLLGGIGVPAGVLSVCIATTIGLAWGVTMRKRERTDILRLMMLGAIVSFGMVGAILLPYEARMAMWVERTPFVVLLNIAGAAIFGTFIERERQLSRREAQLFVEAQTDALTGLLNRRSLDHHFKRIGRPGRVKGTAFLLIDLDHFKDINDSFGHDAGDVVLRTVAETLRSTVRADDLIARMGGEEFLVVLPDTDLSSARRTAERIREAVSNMAVPEHTPDLRITTSVGGHWDSRRLPLDNGLKLADAALYRAKASGRNAVKFSRREALAA
jgi:diguanylate cyclase